MLQFSILKEFFLTALLWLVGSIALAQQSLYLTTPLADRAKLPPNLRNLPLHRLSSGALMLLDRDNNLVLPPRSITTAKGETTGQEAASAPFFPELTSFGIADALLDPTLELVDGNGNVVGSSDNWKDSRQAAIQATGLAPGDDHESAILTTLIQGNWTAIVRGKNNTTGVGLIEVYRVQ